jgi:hypothetical protein
MLLACHRAADQLLHVPPLVPDLLGESRASSSSVEEHGAAVHARTDTKLVLEAEHHHEVHESPWSMLGPLVILAISVASAAAGSASSVLALISRRSLDRSPIRRLRPAARASIYLLSGVAVAVALLGWFLAYTLLRQQERPRRQAGRRRFRASTTCWFTSTGSTSSTTTRSSRRSRLVALHSRLARRGRRHSRLGLAAGRHCYASRRTGAPLAIRQPAQLLRRGWPPEPPHCSSSPSSAWYLAPAEWIFAWFGRATKTWTTSSFRSSSSLRSWAPFW